MAGFASQSLFGPAGSDNGMFFARTAIAAAGGCAGAVIAKGSCANGAITAAFAHMYNHESRGKNIFPKKVGKGKVGAAIRALEFAYTKGGAELLPAIGGWKRVKFEGTTIWIDDDLICIECKDDLGRTSLRLMSKGNAPIGIDGKPINLHHILQTDKSSLVEVTNTQHDKYRIPLHNLYPRGTNSKINRRKFNNFKKRYWRRRSKMF